ncbi:MAG: ribonuclease R [Myxococcota bacterium]
MRVLHDRKPRAMHANEVASKLGVAKRDRDQVRRQLDELVALGVAQEMPGGRFRSNDKPAEERRKPGFGRGPTAVGLPRGTSAHVRGRITMHPRGFGFVSAEDGGPDVFLPPDALGTAMHGDYVEVDTRSTRKGREGRVVDVLGRGVQLVTGTVRSVGRQTWLEPDDARLAGPMPVRGRVPREALRNQAVVATIERYPRSANDAPMVRFVEVLGEHGTTTVEVSKIRIREGVVEKFSDEAMEAADALPSHVTASERRGREDLRNVDLVTIDPEDARDHDDAVWTERLGDGGWRAIVAIADVSHYVSEASPLDREAFARGCSVYLPDRVIPMLPEKISNDLASLVPGKDRLCLAVEIELGPTGAIRKRRFIEGVMRSGGHLTYPGVARALGWTDDAERQPEAEARVDSLRTLTELTKVLRRRRLKRGALDLDLPEAKVLLDPDGTEPIDVYRTRKDPGIRRAYQLVEEMMLLANEVVAQEMSRLGVPTIYRVHGEPDDQKIDVFAQVATSLGHPIDPEDATDPRKLSGFLRKMEGSPHQPVISYLLLRAMQQASYDTHNIGHFGLAAGDYLHFTSPIRRYPDLVVHRIVRRVVQGNPPDPLTARPELRRAAAEASRLERRAMSVERDVMDLYRTVLMRDRVGEQFEGNISGLAQHGFYTRFDDPFVEALTPVERLEDDYFELDQLGVRLVGRRTDRAYALGDRLRVELVDVNVTQRNIIAVPVGIEQRPAREADGGGGKPRSPRRGRVSGRRKDDGGNAGKDGAGNGKGKSKRRRNRRKGPPRGKPS